MELSECETCGNAFLSKGDWHTQCFHCFLDTPKGQAWKARKDHEAKGGSAYHEYREVSTGLSKEMLKKLIMLCHPDKHNGSELATAMTQELLRMREGMK